MKLSNIKLGTRITGGFSLVLLMMAGIVLVATMRLQTLGQVVNAMVNDTFAKSTLVARWLSLSELSGSRSLAAISDPDPVETKLTIDKMTKSSADISELQNKLDKLSKNDDEKALFVTMSKQRATMIAARQAAFEMKKTDLAKAAEMAKKEVLPLLQIYNDTLRDFEAYERKAADQTAAATADLVGSTRHFLLILGVIAVFLGITVAAFIVRNVKQQLGGEPSYASDVANRIASGDLSERVEANSSTGKSLLESMSRMQGGLVELVQGVQAGATAIASACGEIASGNRDLSVRTEQQASSLEETASTMEELTTTVKQNAVNAKEANDLAASASTIAEKGGKVVAEVVVTMDSINQSARQIADIIGVIDGIAFQTNILALNAAVEAARAGEQGRGFAVVASEVRNLAQRSAGAAKEIKTLINASVDTVDRGSRLVSDAGVTMDEVVRSVRQVSTIMSEILSASQEQSLGIEQINQAVTQMDAMTQQNAALVEEATAAADALLGQAQNLDERVTVFKIRSGNGHQAAT